MATTLASNVEATLTFALATKLVDMLLALQQGSGGSNSMAWILGAMCLMVLSVSTSSVRSPSPPQLSASRDMVSMLNQTLVLAFSRIVLLQVRGSELHRLVEMKFCIVAV